MINANLFIPLTIDNSGRSCSQGSALYFRKSSIHCNSSGLITLGRFQERLTPLGNCHMGLSLVPTKRVPRNSKVPTPPLFNCQTPVPSAKSSAIKKRERVGFLLVCFHLVATGLGKTVRLRSALPEPLRLTPLAGVAIYGHHKLCNITIAGVPILSPCHLIHPRAGLLRRKTTINTTSRN